MSPGISTHTGKQSEVRVLPLLAESSHIRRAAILLILRITLFTVLSALLIISASLHSSFPFVDGEWAVKEKLVPGWCSLTLDLCSPSFGSRAVSLGYLLSRNLSPRFPRSPSGRPL